MNQKWRICNFGYEKMNEINFVKDILEFVSSSTCFTSSVTKNDLSDSERAIVETKSLSERCLNSKNLIQNDSNILIFR